MVVVVVVVLVVVVELLSGSSWNSALWLLHGASDSGSSLQRIILCLFPLLGIPGSVSINTSSSNSSLQYGSTSVIEQHPRKNFSTSKYKLSHQIKEKKYYIGPYVI